VTSGIAAGDNRLVDRDRELERIRRRLHEAYEGQGGALAVEGPAGMGKTALLAAARQAAETDGFRILRARGAELESEFAFGVVRQLVERLLAEASPVDRASLLEGPAQLALSLLAIVGAQDGTGEAGPVAPDPSFAVLHGLYWLCANLADQGPVLLVVDDAHWADAPSLRFLAYLLPRLDELRITVLLAARPADAGPGRRILSALTMDPATEVVRLAPLTSDGVARLIARGLGSEPDPGFVAACREATGGTPFLVHTLVAALAEEGIDPVEASSARVQGMATATTGRWHARWQFWSAATWRRPRLSPGSDPPKPCGPPSCSCARACWRTSRSPSPILSCARGSTGRCRRPSALWRMGARRAC
jgi:predicted ATPase